MCEFGGKRADHKEHLFVSLCPFQKRRKYFKPRYTNLQTCLHSSFSRLHLFPGQNGHSANSSSAQHRLCSVFCVVAGASRVEWLFPHLSAIQCLALLNVPAPQLETAQICQRFIKGENKVRRIYQKKAVLYKKNPAFFGGKVYWCYNPTSFAIWCR